MPTRQSVPNPSSADNPDVISAERALAAAESDLVSAVAICGVAINRLVDTLQRIERLLGERTP
jgi:hypothetical protein